ncbi:MAG: Gfo/Idh/MocA family oxidoreductase [Chloroflexi bacterium]|nr:Gfo/Idh/MocA family oxidoreductase [Chloroflexota bacterium]
MADKKLRWGLLSTARINRAVIPPIRASARNELLAVASRTRETGKAYAREWGIPRLHVGYEALLADPEIDAIYISLPNSLHAEWSIKCAEAGKHVLCEKPVAITIAEVERMMAAARKNRTVLAEAFMYRHHPQTLKVRELIQQGVIGKPSSVHGRFTFSIATEDDVRLDPDLGGGSVWDVGCYPVSYTRSALGEEPIEVFGWQRLTARGVENTFAGTMRFASGVLATFDCGFRSPQRWGMEIVGAEGTITLTNPFKPGMNDIILLRRGDQTDAIPVTPQELYIGEVEDMADAVLDGKPPRISLEDSLANVKTLLALYQSAKEGKPIKL